jgi:hypothetical protein
MVASASSREVGNKPPFLLADYTPSRVTTISNICILVSQTAFGFRKLSFSIMTDHGTSKYVLPRDFFLNAAGSAVGDAFFPEKEKVKQRFFTAVVGRKQSTRQAALSLQNKLPASAGAFSKRRPWRRHWKQCVSCRIRMLKQGEETPGRHKHVRRTFRIRS